MALTTEQLAKISQFLAIQLRNGCPNCHCRTFAQPVVARLINVEAGDGEVPELPMVIIRCASCGHGSLFDGGFVGVAPPTPGMAAVKPTTFSAN